MISLSIHYITFLGSTLLGEALGKKSFAPPYLAPNSGAEMTNNGVNYASGSSGIFDETGSFYVCEFLNCLAVINSYFPQFSSLTKRHSLKKTYETSLSYIIV